ncbi:MgtC/SapB family protein [Salibacterium halotolerans]|uniref:Putative Mg2+ transporter-C (MgtC) family protein n=1 Tax=Salibacterium halotolerans TaxID=1884432 RepID=A0A1I5WC31_9BACI|nr:MgtC/SapB family protein [Salibacterium halotolerans]SFQ17259.1 putative Mg2+ transporter-C (MgtC) family protein [Salibacterium halotolerans]
MDVLWTEDSVVIMVRILSAAVLAGLIGAEREYKKHPAGFRTHLLVGTGACLAMVMALFGFQPYLEENPDISAYDPSRLASYVISGVGFLGAGTIIVQGVSVKGLTTAASIWVVASIGLAAGAGMYFAALLTTIVVLLSLLFLHNIERLFQHTSTRKKVEVTVGTHHTSLSNIIKIFEEQNILVKNITGSTEHEAQEQNISFVFDIESPPDKNTADLYDQLIRMEGVQKVDLAVSS